MKNIIPSFITFLAMAITFSCESENIEDKYIVAQQQATPNDSLPDAVDNTELTWLPLNGNLNDSTTNNTPLVLVGKQDYVEGINRDYGKGLHLDGSSYLIVNLGFYDTLSIAFWIKGDGELESTNSPVLVDYGHNNLSVQLDATTGATALTLKKNEYWVYSYDNSSIEYLNSFNKYCFVYIESGADKTEVFFKGYNNSGEELVYYDELDLSGIIEADSDILYIGRSSQKANQGSSYFRGAIDEIHIYNKTLSLTEIESLAAIPTI